MKPDSMNPDFMNSDPHERARLMIALFGEERPGPEELSNAERSWLAAHLESCASCREFAENSRETSRFHRAQRRAGHIANFFE